MLKRAAVALIVVSFAAVAIAHAQSKRGPNGGMIATSDEHPIEFIAQGPDLTFYISDHDGTPLSTKGLQGRATVQDRGKTTTVPLTPAEPNKLIGKAPAPLASKARVVFSMKVHEHLLTARFVTE